MITPESRRADNIFLIRMCNVRGRIDYLQSIRPLKTPDPTDYTSFLLFGCDSFFHLSLVPAALSVTSVLKHPVNIWIIYLSPLLLLLRTYILSFRGFTFCLMEEFLYLLYREKTLIIEFRLYIAVRLKCFLNFYYLFIIILLFTLFVNTFL